MVSFIIENANVQITGKGGMKVKKYVKPVFEVAQVRVTERIAGSSCTEHGSCYGGDIVVPWECIPGWTNPDANFN